MNGLDMYYSQAELHYREDRLRSAIAGHKARRTLKARRRRTGGSALAV